MYKQQTTNNKENNTILDYIYIVSGIALFTLTLINIINN